MTTKHTPATPLTPVQQFYSTHKPSDAIRLAMADHAAHCDPMMPQGDFMRALQKALDRTEAYPRLVAALRAVVDMRGHHTVYPWMNDENTIEAFKDARALLRELGESE